MGCSGEQLGDNLIMENKLFAIGCSLGVFIISSLSLYGSGSGINKYYILRLNNTEISVKTQEILS